MLVLIIVVLLTYNINAQTWEEIGFNLPTGDSVSYNTEITFANKNIGWLYTEFYHENEYLGSLYRTTNGGESWDKIENLNINFSAYVTLFSTEPDFFYITSSSSAAYTNDGGITWNYINLSTTGFLEIYFFDNKNGVAGDGYSWITSDGGKTWNRKGKLAWPRGFYFHNHKLGWAVGYSPSSEDDGYIAKTTDGGTSWVYQDSTFGGMVDYFGIDFIDSLKGFAVGGSTDKTIDGGNNWETYPGQSGYDIGFLDDRHGWISSAGNILNTSDGGETWEAQLDSIMHYLFIKIMVLKKDRFAYVLGINPINYNATLLRADLSGITNVENNKKTTPNNFYLYQNYPNPFNPVTTISYELPVTGFVNLTIYDVLGEKVDVLVNEEKNAGKNIVTWNGERFSSGIYTARLTTGEFDKSIKLLLLK